MGVIGGGKGRQIMGGMRYGNEKGVICRLIYLGR